MEALSLFFLCYLSLCLSLLRLPNTQTRKKWIKDVCIGKTHFKEMIYYCLVSVFSLERFSVIFSNLHCADTLQLNNSDKFAKSAATYEGTIQLISYCPVQRKQRYSTKTRKKKYSTKKQKYTTKKISVDGTILCRTWT